MVDFGIGILGTGKYLPGRILTNSDLEKMVDTSDEWIVRRTGMKKGTCWMRILRRMSWVLKPLGLLFRMQV
ncbi:hypothetical protein [Thermoclostridium stercorarium]